MNPLRDVHRYLLGQYRLDALIRQVAEVVPEEARVLDVGCGNGKLAAGVLALRPDVQIEGLDITVSPDAAIPVHTYDGARLPFDDKTWDVCMANDVLHHCDDPGAMLGELCRVARWGVVLKDHVADSRLDGFVLGAMDWIGNRGYGTPLPYNFLSSAAWEALFAAHGLHVEAHRSDLRLYPPWFLGVLDRQMHFLAYLSLPEG